MFCGGDPRKFPVSVKPMEAGDDHYLVEIIDDWRKSNATKYEGEVSRLSFIVRTP